MTPQPLVETLLLLGLAVAIVTGFQRLRIPSSLAYFLVGVILGPHTAGPVLDSPYIQVAGEFGIVFLLFTIGLNFSLPQIYALRHLVLGLGTAQVLLTTAVVGVLAWLLGLPPAAAFVVGAVFAQSSSTIISKQLLEQGEDQTRHGRLGLAMSVFQDVTAAPLVVIIPVVGTMAAGSIALPLAGTLGKAVLAFGLVFLAGRWLLRPLFHEIAARRSPELFTLTVLLVSLLSAWMTQAMGLSMAFGAFLAGMMLGETEFRHQIESDIRPFRDVLLGLFFVTIGMLVNPAELREVWHWSLVGAIALLMVKTALVMPLVRLAGIDMHTAWRTAIVLAVGGEFGFALLAIALGSEAITVQAGQATLGAVLISMLIGPFLIRYNQSLSAYARRPPEELPSDAMIADLPGRRKLRNHVIICGYGRIGRSVGRFLEEERIGYMALDLDPDRVREARAAGEPVYYGDAAERHVLEKVGLENARLVVVSHENTGAAIKLLHHVRMIRPDLPVMVRTRDEAPVEELRLAGATEVVPETLEAGMMIVSHALLLLDVPLSRIARVMRDLRADRYRLLGEFFRGDHAPPRDWQVEAADEVKSVNLAPGAYAIGRSLQELELDRNRILVTALVREGRRRLAPGPATRLKEGDVLVLFGQPEELRRVEARLLSQMG
jgi:monovalent cation:H+ antiporter-2, CPA2 family